jgi:hypothetical protein
MSTCNSSTDLCNCRPSDTELQSSSRNLHSEANIQLFNKCKFKLPKENERTRGQLGIYLTAIYEYARYVALAIAGFSQAGYSVYYVRVAHLRQDRIHRGERAARRNNRQVVRNGAATRERNDFDGCWSLF